MESGACSGKQRNYTEHYIIGDDKTPIEYVCNLDASFDKQMGPSDFGGNNN